MSVKYARPDVYAQSAAMRISPNEYAILHGVSVRTVYRWIADRSLKAQKVGRQWRIDADALPEQR